MHISSLARFQRGAGRSWRGRRGVAPNRPRDFRGAPLPGSHREGVHRLERRPQGQGCVPGAERRESECGPWRHPRRRSRDVGRRDARLYESSGLDGFVRSAPGNPCRPARESSASPRSGARRDHAPCGRGEALGAATRDGQGTRRRLSDRRVSWQRSGPPVGRPGGSRHPWGASRRSNPASRRLPGQHPAVDERGPLVVQRGAPGASHSARGRRNSGYDTGLGRRIAPGSPGPGRSSGAVQPAR